MKRNEVEEPWCGVSIERLLKVCPRSLNSEADENVGLPTLPTPSRGQLIRRRALPPRRSPPRKSPPLCKEYMSALGFWNVFDRQGVPI